MEIQKKNVFFGGGGIGLVEGQFKINFFFGGGGFGRGGGGLVGGSGWM